MISPLIELETRRKILFADDFFTIRSLGADSVLLTLSSKAISPRKIENCYAFLRNQTSSTSITSLIIDISVANNLTLSEAFAFAKMKEHGFQRFAVLSRKITMRLLFTLILPNTQTSRFKLFNNLASAIAWTRTSK